MKRGGCRSNRPAFISQKKEAEIASGFQATFNSILWLRSRAQRYSFFRNHNHYYNKVRFDALPPPLQRTDWSLTG